MIAWNHDIAAAPRDGRELLLALRNILGTADGGDGVKLNPRWPFIYYLADWIAERGRWETTESDWDEHVDLDPDEPCAWAEINPPEPPKITP